MGAITNVGGCILRSSAGMLSHKEMTEISGDGQGYRGKFLVSRVVTASSAF